MCPVSCDSEAAFLQLNKISADKKQLLRFHSRFGVMDTDVPLMAVRAAPLKKEAVKFEIITGKSNLKPKEKPTLPYKAWRRRACE